MSVVQKAEYQGDSERINGLRVLEIAQKKLTRTVGLTVEASVITDDSFRYYREHGALPENDKERIRESVPRLVAIASTGALAVRRAFQVPGLENPPGPRHLDIKDPNEAIRAIEDMFNFAIEQKYDQIPGSVIEAFYHPFIATVRFDKDIPENAILPRGGYAVPNDPDAKSVRIVAVFGNNEGVQSLVADEYVVDMQKLIITDKTVPQKEFALCTTIRNQAEKLKLPLQTQFEQVLSDIEILEAAMVVRETTKLMNSPQRAEFAFDGHYMYYNELFPYEIEETTSKILSREGRVLVIDTPSSLQKIEKTSSSQILFVHPSVVQSRDYDVLNALAGIQEDLYILYPGTTVTAHAMRVLVDAGHHAFAVGNTNFNNGDTVCIRNQKGRILIENIDSISKTSQSIIPLSESDNYSFDVVGSKAYHLGKLSSLGYRVPKGIVITTKEVDNEKFLSSSEFNLAMEGLDQTKRYSVRSSADVEDGDKNAFAGQFHTEINVKVRDIPDAVKKVWASAHTTHVSRLMEDLGIEKAQMAVVVQEMIIPSFSGVIFGGNIETHDKNQVVIEITKGLAEGVVDGTAQVLKVVFDKNTRERLSIIGDVEVVDVSNAQIQALFNMYISLEEAFDSQQDVEWTIDPEGDLYLLQTRSLIV